MAEKRQKEIILCSGCLIRADLSVQDFVKSVQLKLMQQRSDVNWEIATYSCFRFCPQNRITVSVSERLTMSREATVAAVVKEILSFDLNK